MNRSLVALLAIAGLAVAGWYFLMGPGKKLADGTAPTADSTPAVSESEPMLFTWENWANPPFVAEYKAKYGVEPRSQIWADEDEAFAKMRSGF